MMADLVALHFHVSKEGSNRPFLGGTFAAEDFQYVHFLSRLWTFPSSCLIDLHAEAIESQPYIKQSFYPTQNWYIFFTFTFWNTVVYGDNEEQST